MNDDDERRGGKRRRANDDEDKKKEGIDNKATWAYVHCYSLYVELFITLRTLASAYDFVAVNVLSLVALLVV
jgi:hypothetical protein